MNVHHFHTEQGADEVEKRYLRLETSGGAQNDRMVTVIRLLNQPDGDIHQRVETAFKTVGVLAELLYLFELHMLQVLMLPVMFL